MNSKGKILITAGAAAAAAGIVYAVRSPRFSGIKMKKSILIDRPISDLYAFWRDFTNLVRITDFVQSVDVLSDTRSRWTVAGPGGIPVHWDAEITKDVPDQIIGWQSLEGSAIETAGYVRFEPTPSGRATLVRVALEYKLPAGKVGAAIASLFGARPAAHLDSLLRRFKQLMETGEMSMSGSRI